MNLNPTQAAIEAGDKPAGESEGDLASPASMEKRLPDAAAFSPGDLPNALLKAIRPHQATKNLFVFAALVFTGGLLNPHLLGRVIVAFFLFSLTAGSIYLLNDLIDVEQDRQHPKKRFRPIASGALPVPLAWASMALLALGSLSAGFLLRPAFGMALLGYFVLQIAYCVTLKHIVLIDIFTIAIGFVLRAVAGALVINANISNWLLLCTLQLALFLGFGKRRQELVLLGAGAGKHRANLDDYSVPLLDQIINIVVGITIVCYSVYSVDSPTAQIHPHLWLTVPVVIYALFRYMYLVYQKGWGGAPDEVLQKDRALQAAIAVWFLLVMLLLKFDYGGWSKFGN